MLWGIPTGINAEYQRDVLAARHAYSQAMRSAGDLRHARLNDANERLDRSSLHSIILGLLDVRVGQLDSNSKENDEQKADDQGVDERAPKDVSTD